MSGVLSIQFNPVLANKAANLNKVEESLEKYSDKKLDLVVLPEFFSTGIDHNSFINAPEDEFGGETIVKICEFAKKYNTNIVSGTVIEKATNGKLYNTSFAINRQGEIIGKYRKKHLFNYMGGNEGENITAGEELVVVDFDFARVGMSICFDIRYPLHIKELVKQGAEIIVLPTAWVVPDEVYANRDSREFAKETWVAMNRTRAFDNLVYVVVCNQVGRINNKISTLGNSMIISPTTEVLKNADYDEKAIFADIDLDVVKYYKSIYPIAQID